MDGFAIDRNDSMVCDAKIDARIDTQFVCWLTLKRVQLHRLLERSEWLRVFLILDQDAFVESYAKDVEEVIYNADLTTIDPDESRSMEVNLNITSLIEVTVAVVVAVAVAVAVAAVDSLHEAGLTVVGALECNDGILLAGLADVKQETNLEISHSFEVVWEPVVRLSAASNAGKICGVVERMDRA